METFNRRLSNLFTNVATILLTLFVIATLFGVFSRYVFNSPLVWSEEAARNLNIWSVFLGATVAVYKADHLRVDIIDRSVEHWPQAVRSLLSLILVLGEALFTLSLLIGGWHMTVDRWAVPLTTLPINQGWIYLAAPASAVFMLWFLAWQAVTILRQLIGKGEVSQ